MKVEKTITITLSEKEAGFLNNLLETSVNEGLYDYNGEGEEDVLISYLIDKTNLD